MQLPHANKRTNMTFMTQCCEFFKQCKTIDLSKKVGFTTENIQPLPEEIGAPIVNYRYWSTEP